MPTFSLSLSILDTRQCEHGHLKLMLTDVLQSDTAAFFLKSRIKTLVFIQSRLCCFLFRAGTLGPTTGKYARLISPEGDKKLTSMLRETSGSLSVYSAVVSM